MAGSPGTPSLSTTRIAARLDGQHQDEPVPHTIRYSIGDNRIDITLDDGAKSSLWWATKNEWLGLLDVSGLELEALYGGFAGESFDDDSREYVFVARRRATKPPHGVRVAETGSGVVGWAALSAYDAKPCFHRTGSTSTYVERAVRGTWVGTALRLHLMERARAGGFHTLASRVWATNEASIPLWARLGWERVAHLREVVDYGGRLIDCYLIRVMAVLGPLVTRAARRPALTGDRP